MKRTPWLSATLIAFSVLGAIAAGYMLISAAISLIQAQTLPASQEVTASTMKLAALFLVANAVGATVVSCLLYLAARISEYIDLHIP